MKCSGDRMPYIDEKIINEVKKIDALTYVSDFESYDLKRCGKGYSLKTHDSLKFSNGKWMWHSRGIGGRSALDFLIKVRGNSFIDAVKFLAESYGIFSKNDDKNFKNNQKNFQNEDKIFSKIEKNFEEKFQKNFILPQKNESSFVLKNYLISRKIDEEIIDFCIENGLIYEEKNHHSIVFAGYDENGSPAHASFRSTQGRVLGDVSGSRKDYSFKIKLSGKKTVHVFESAIDLLSYATLVKMTGHDFKKENYLSLDGVAGSATDDENISIPAALKKYLELYPETERIFLHLDNDNAGRTAAGKIKISLRNMKTVIDSPPPSGKDVNDFLMWKCRN